MEQRNENIFHINYKNQMYVLSTSLVGNKIKLVCTDSLSQTFDGEFALEDLFRLSRYFQPTHSIEQIQGYLNGIIGKQRVGFVQNGDALSIVLYLINKDIISIPLIRKETNTNSFDYNNYTHYNITQNFQGNHYIPGGNIYNSGNTNILQDNAQNINDILKLIQNPNQNQQQYTRINQGIEKVEAKGVPIQKAKSTSLENFDSKYDEKKLGKLENDTNTIKVEQEKLRKDMKKLIDEASKLKEQNQVYKTDHDSLTKENAQLKNENDNYQKQVKELQEENNNLKNQIVLLNKDVDAFESQNNEIRKMYAELENDNNMYKNQVDELNKENELLRGQIDELNNNFTLINNELEKIKDENNIFKNNLEQQKDNMNEDLINKLEEENKFYKQKAEENELLKKQIEELQYQLQIGQERQIEDGEEGKEVKGDIIHDIKELEMITKKINKDEDKKIIINLLYKASVDSDRASAFHEKCDQAQNTIVLVETKNGKRFGGYTTCSWSGNCVDKNDPEAFIFSFDKMKTYDNIPGDEAIGCYPKFGPIFLGCQIKIFDNAFTKGGTTFEKELNFYTEEDYELTGGDRTFEVKDIEVYEVIIE